MFRFVFLFVAVLLLPVLSYSQENANSAKKSGYEKLLETPGSVVLSRKYSVGDPKFLMTATVSYRIDAASSRIYTLDTGVLSIDLEQLPRFVRDLEIFMAQMKAADGKDGESVFFRYSDKFWVSFSSFFDDKGKSQQSLYFDSGRFEGSGRDTEKTLADYIKSLKAGLTKLQEIQRLGS